MREVADRKTRVAGQAGGTRDTAIFRFLSASRLVTWVPGAVLVGCLVLAGRSAALLRESEHRP